MGYTLKGGALMASKSTRQMVSLNNELYLWVKNSAKHSQVSISEKVRQYLEEIYELHEEMHWAGEAEKRLKNFDADKLVKHKDAWK